MKRLFLALALLFIGHVAVHAEQYYEVKGTVNSIRYVTDNEIVVQLVVTEPKNSTFVVGDTPKFVIFSRDATVIESKTKFLLSMLLNNMNTQNTVWVNFKDISSTSTEYDYELRQAIVYK